MKAIFEKLTGVFVCDDDTTKVKELTPYHMGVNLLLPREPEVDPEPLPGPEFERPPSVSRVSNSPNYNIDPGAGPGLIWFLHFNGQDVKNQLKDGVWSGPAGTLVLFSQVVLNGKTEQIEVVVQTVAKPITPRILRQPTLTGTSDETGRLFLDIGEATDNAEESVQWFNGVQPLSNELYDELPLAGRSGQQISVEVTWFTSSGGSVKSVSNTITVTPATSITLTNSGAVVVPIRIEIMAVELNDFGAVLTKV